MTNEMTQWPMDYDASQPWALGSIARRRQVGRACRL